MKAVPILFSGPMVCALLDGVKTQTRRTRAPRWEVGDRLWVREAWCPANSEDGPVVLYRANHHRWYPEHDGQDEGAGPSFDYDKFPVAKGAWSAWAPDVESGSTRAWRPGIHMPRWANRLTLTVEAVRSEPLIDITELDAVHEGIRNVAFHGYVYDRWQDGCDLPSFATPKLAYAALWEKINGPGSWAKNPTVWATTFRVARQNIDGEERP